MAMNYELKSLIQSVADNDLQKAKAYVKSIIAKENTEKNKAFCNSIKTKLEAPSASMIELPHNVRNLLKMEDVAVSFNEKRYYLTDRESRICEQIITANAVNSRLAEMGIRFLNSTLLYGESGTGKTTFGRYVAYKLGVPFAYLNFSHCIGSHLGDTGKNIASVFDYVKANKCVFMLDEVDAIGLRRGGYGGAEKEMSRVVIGLMQALDLLENEVVVIGATNRFDVIDEALIRRFSLRHEVKPLEAETVASMAMAFLDDVGVEYNTENIKEYAETKNKQSEIVNDITLAIVKMLKDNAEFELLAAEQAAF